MQDTEGAKAPAEGTALETASALAAIAAVTEGLGPYLSPYLPRLLALLSSHALLACGTAGCNSAALSILTQLATAIPARLLLAPLAARFETSLQVRPMECKAESLACTCGPVHARLIKLHLNLTFSKH